MAAAPILWHRTLCRCLAAATDPLPKLDRSATIRQRRFSHGSRMEEIRVVTVETKQEQRLWNELHCECRAVDEAVRLRIHAECRDFEEIVFLASPWNTKNSRRCEVEGVGGSQRVLISILEHRRQSQCSRAINHRDRACAGHDLGAKIDDLVRSGAI